MMPRSYLTIFAGEPLVRELLFEILNTGETRSILQYRARSCYLSKQPHFSQHQGCLPLKKSFQKIGSKVDGTRLFSRSSGKFPGATEHLKR